MDCLYALDRLPYRCPLAREAKKAKRQIRCLLFGKRRNVYRILYEVDEANRAVWILHIRHGARRDMKAGEIRLMPTQL
jgi:mRNA-degrading endonuclease RelE of RelBE toxin-antitoxin system